jgi:hypothetical protein
MGSRRRGLPDVMNDGSSGQMLRATLGYLAEANPNGCRLRLKIPA